MKKTLFISIRFTLLTAVLLGVAYPLAVTAFAHYAMPRQADGSLLSVDGHIAGSQLIGQQFTGDRYFHGRPSAAGNGYDATSSGGSNFAQSNAKLVARINHDAAEDAARTGKPAPIDLVTASASGLDPDITPAGALYQVNRVAEARHMDPQQLRSLVEAHITGRQFGFLGEPRVNVLELNLALDQSSR
ncbi:potassium-transporting ATPase subunit KdpC [Acidipila rosea]|uniref:Potassium-transporting ATPase KdpC subunit n=1 Tax=Acidipila rosea TaxID=768535 RepID=A0A4V2PVC3_9BACT|nr:potassium-transporting ATPase subunit KdpC [Acidipila rosea]TCK73921.1 K+-transporting ATPase ATPase C chain [Acidipila rosea]